MQGSTMAVQWCGWFQWICDSVALIILAHERPDILNRRIFHTLASGRNREEDRRRLSKRTIKAEAVIMPDVQVRWNGRINGRLSVA